MTPIVPTWSHVRTQLGLLSELDPADILAHTAPLDHPATSATGILQGADGASLGVAASFGSANADDLILSTFEELTEPETRDLLARLFRTAPDAPRFYEISRGPEGRLVAGLDGVDLPTLRNVLGDQVPAEGADFRLGLHLGAGGRQMLFGHGRDEGVLGPTPLRYTRALLPRGTDVEGALARRSIDVDADRLAAASALFAGRTPTLLTRNDRARTAMLCWTCAGAFDER